MSFFWYKISPPDICLRFQEIVGYLERQYDDILAEESRIKRNPRFRDNRVHALLYFIPPTGHAYVKRSSFRGIRFYACNRLREMDIELMRRLSPRVNVIPVIGKADSLTPSELKGFKKRVGCLFSRVSNFSQNLGRLWKILSTMTFLSITSLMTWKKTTRKQFKTIVN